MRIYGHLRASTKEQDAKRAKSELLNFAKDNGFTIAAWFTENESGATLKRPELFRLLDIAQSGDVLLVEQVDRISRLTAEDWEKLKLAIMAKGIKIVSLDLPTSHQFMQLGDEFTERLLERIITTGEDVRRKEYSTPSKKENIKVVEKIKFCMVR